VAADTALPSYDYLKVSPTDLQKFDRNAQVILLKGKRTPKKSKKGTKKTKK